MLARVLDLNEMEVDQSVDPRQALAWESLPERMIVPIHARPEPEFRAILEQHNFRTIVIARHPLDVLLSTLAFSQHDRSTRFWLAGAGGDEQGIQGASPTSEAFLLYATSSRAAALLSISAQWWQTSGACRVRYEDLIHDTSGQVEKIVATLGVSPRMTPAEVIETSSPEAMSALQVEWLYHIWQRQPGSWKRLLPPDAARRVCNFHHDVMNGYGYACDADDSLDAAGAQATWERIDAAVVKRNVNGVKQALAKSEQRRRLDHAQLVSDMHAVSAQVEPLSAKIQQVSELAEALQAVRSHHDRALENHEAVLERLTRQFASLPHKELRELSEIGPWSIAIARWLHRWSKRFPRVASKFKSLVTLARSMTALL